MWWADQTLHTSDIFWEPGLLLVLEELHMPRPKAGELLKVPCSPPPAAAPPPPAPSPRPLAREQRMYLAGKFTLDSSSDLQVAVNKGPQGSAAEIDHEVTNTRGSLILHWGALTPDRKTGSSHPGDLMEPQCTRTRALSTPFVKSGDNSTLRIEVDDPAVQAIEFLIFDEAQIEQMVSVLFRRCCCAR
ncbi:hypothetical protein ACP4OV_015050 [Aristida adscensionis]